MGRAASANYISSEQANFNVQDAMKSLLQEEKSARVTMQFRNWTTVNSQVEQGMRRMEVEGNVFISQKSSIQTHPKRIQNGVQKPILTNFFQCSKSKLFPKHFFKLQTNYQNILSDLEKNQF